jgi:hypothetical protein
VREVRVREDKGYRGRVREEHIKGKEVGDNDYSIIHYHEFYIYLLDQPFSVCTYRGIGRRDLREEQITEGIIGREGLRRGKKGGSKRGGRRV